MRKFLLLAALVAGVAIIYSVFNDPVKKERLMDTIEGSTGVELDASPEKVLGDAGKAVGDAAQELLKDLGDTLTDPEFHRLLERWGKDALNKLDEVDAGRLKKDLERESGKDDADYDAILEKYLGGIDNS